MPNKPKNQASGRPLTGADLDICLPPRPPRKPAGITRTQRLFVRGGSEPPTVRTRIVPVPRVGGGRDYEVVIEVDNVRTEARAAPPALKGKPMRRGEQRLGKAELDRLLAGFVPDHLALSVRPQQLLKPFRRIPLRGSDDRRIPTLVIGADGRSVFQDTAFPWCTTGLVQTNRGAGSGVMVGPRHLLTVSHIIDWTSSPDFVCNWVRFTPSYFDGDAPFGEAYGTNIYWYVQEDGDNSISGAEAVADYVVVVLDDRMGDKTGWMGTRGYDDDWDSLDVWSHIGYPSDLNSGERPVFVGGFRMDGSDSAQQAMMHECDVFFGQSGGPMFGWWDGEPWPRAVAVQSFQTSSQNGASGGADLSNLVARALNEFG